MVEKTHSMIKKMYPHKLWVAITAMFLALWMLEGSVQHCRGAIPQTAGPSTSSVYALAGEFRTVFANMLWIKVDKYMHEYVEHGGDAFEHKEALPMIRMIVDLDPHFVEAYRTGAVILYLGLHKDEEAIKFLREGISNNPKSWDLYEEMGMFYARHKGDLKTSLPYFEKAYQCCDDDFYKKRLKRLIGSVKRDIREAEKQ